MYRATSDPKYREWGWNMFQSFEKHTRVPTGYASVENVDIPAGGTVQHKDRMESFYLAEALKYFYLLFSDEDLFPVNEWVFNTEAHPLPIYTR